MKDEVLSKALDTDSEIIPRYDLVGPDGTIIAENVQLILKNPVVAQGTPLNKQNLLSDDTSRAYGLDPATSTPDSVFNVIRTAAGFCPKLAVKYGPGGTVSIRNETTLAVQQKVVPAEGFVSFDIFEYGGYTIWGEFYGVRSDYPGFLLIDTTKLYQVELEYFMHTIKIQVANEVGATITAKHSDGLTLTGTVGADKTCSIAVPKAGSYTISGTYDGCTSVVITQSISANNTTSTFTLAWVTVTVRADTGSTITVTSGTFTKGGVTANGLIVIWLPGFATYTINATLGDKSTTGSVATSEYKNYNITLRYL